MHGIVYQWKLKHRLLCHLLKIKYCIILVTKIETIQTEVHLLTDALPLQTRSYKLEHLIENTAYVAGVSVGNVVGFGPETRINFKTLHSQFPVTPIEVGTTSVVLLWEVRNLEKPSIEYYVHALKNGLEEELFIVKAEYVKVDGNTQSAEV